MKYLLICFTLSLQCSCNKKAQIVEEIKKVKKDIVFVERDQTLIKLRDKDLIDDFNKTGKWNEAVRDSVHKAAFESDLKMAGLNQKLDSLELELKKY